MLLRSQVLSKGTSPSSVLYSFLKQDKMSEENFEVLQYPSQLYSYAGHSRKVGIELEFTGLELEAIADLIVQRFGGSRKFVNPYLCYVEDTDLGRFSVEIDAQLLKEMVIQGYLEDLGITRAEDVKFRGAIDKLLKEVAQSVVPFEVCTPPIPIYEIPRIEELKNELRQAGAKGTEDSIIYAFGLQLNPEVPSLDVKSILDHLRAFFISYPWLKQEMEIDFTRQLTPYINAFSKRYMRKALDPHYQPSIQAFTEDYLYYNPTRNRALDLLPLLAYIDEKQVRTHLEDSLIKPRPTFHYRLPNSKVSLKSWRIISEWNYWLIVESLAIDKEALERLSQAYLNYLSEPFATKQDWLPKFEAWLNGVKSNPS